MSGDRQGWRKRGTAPLACHQCGNTDGALTLDDTRLLCHACREREQQRAAQHQHTRRRRHDP
jgi:hypothetical protein